MFFTVDVETVVLGEGLVSVPVAQLHTQAELPLIGQNVNKLVSQPVFSRHTPEALAERERGSREGQFNHRLGSLEALDETVGKKPLSKIFQA